MYDASSHLIIVGPKNEVESGWQAAKAKEVRLG